MNILGYIALFGWIPVVLLLFATLPSRTAAVAASVGAWLFLPVAEFPLPGLPDYTKVSATTVGLLLGTVLFDRGRVSSLRLRWFDLPMLVWCVTPFASSMANDLGAYDGLSGVVAGTVTWGLPYLIGRAYFTDLDSLRELATGIFIGGLIYMPLCLWEIQMSPQLHRIIYGYAPSDFIMAIRYGGYRPILFMKTGLEVGMWMTAASLMGYGLWATGALRRLWGLPLGRLLLGLLVTAVLCKSTGALALLALGIGVLWVAVRSGSSLPIWALVLVPMLYMPARAIGWWSGEDAVRLAGVLGEDRAGSLEFRLSNEDILAAKALQRPVFGWGGWGRARVYDEEGRDISITDGLWIIALGNHGIVGLGSLTAAILLPVALLPWRHPARSWKDPQITPAAALAVLTSINMIDNINNAMYNPIYIMTCGGLVALSGRRGSATGGSGLEPSVVSTNRASDNGLDHFEARHLDLLAGHSGPGIVPPVDSEYRRDLALHHDALARILEDSGHVREAERCRNLNPWAWPAAEFPDHPESWGRWLDGLNDLAWSLANDCGPKFPSPVCAVMLAEEAVMRSPGCATYWNTLGAAYYRAENWDFAIRALERSMGLGSEGTGFDYFFLAMAHWRRGDKGRAREWFDRADAWLEGHDPESSELLRLRAEATRIINNY